MLKIFDLMLVFALFRTFLYGGELNGWRRVKRLTELLALPGNSPSKKNYRFSSEMFTLRKRVTHLGEFLVERAGISPRRDEYFTM